MSDAQHGPAHGAGSEPDLLAARLSDLARSLEHEREVQPTLDAIVAAAVDTIPGAAHASISAVRGRREVVTLASTSDVARAVDQAQYRAGQGPCLDALYERLTVRLPDLAEEHRWPRFTRRAAGLSIASMLAVQLFVRGDDLGALNLFGGRPNAFDEDSEHVALLFAAHAAVALAGAQAQEQLRGAMGTRAVIGQAQGILMERLCIDDDRAFALLVRASQESNRKLRDIAADVVQGRRPPPR